LRASHHGFFTIVVGSNGEKLDELRMLEAMDHLALWHKEP
jgi:hypothetical protein